MRDSKLHGQFFDTCMDKQPGRQLAMQIQSGEELLDVVMDLLAGDSQ
jgi:hypothetical protein